MNEFVASLVPLIGRALLHFLWQGVVIALVAALLLQLLRDARPQVRYAVGCLALLACALAPFADIAWQLSVQSVATPAMPGGFKRNALAGTLSLAPLVPSAYAGLAALRIDQALPWIVSVWAAGACALSLRMAMGVWWIRRSCALPQDLRQPLWQVRLDAIAANFGLRQPVVLRLVDSGVSPASVGWWRPVVLLPTALLMRMPVELVEALLAHELAHVRRHDYLVNLLQGAVEAMLFYHPVTWWLSGRIRHERELIADQLAAQAIKAPRRLAVALSELSECLASAGSTQDSAHDDLPAPALSALGGHLMIRIEQLVRPGLRRSGGRIAFPLVGLAAACLAFYAQAQIRPEAATVATNAAPATSTKHGNRAKVGHGSDRPFAIVRKGREGFIMSGSTDEIDDIKAVRQGLDRDFVWFRKGNQAYVVVDPAIVDRAAQAWADTDKLDERMEALDAQMEVHDRKMEALDARMDQVSDRGTDPAMEAASKRMEALAQQQAALGAKQAKLAAAMVHAGEQEQQRLSQEMDALSDQQDALSRQMDAQSAVLEAQSERMEQQMKPMEELGRQMEEASKPMEALGKQMEALGEQMDRLSERAERETLQLIDDAVARGLAEPAPSRR
jgi:beta-lactamase regulating signal transducer with metallopeptidase domain